MATATAHGSAVTATELDQAATDVLAFLSDALADACTLSSALADDMVLEKIEEWSKSRVDHALYNEPALLKHKEIFDMLTYDKQGKPRENTFLKWCRKVYAIREADGTVQEHAEASEDQVRQWYKILAVRMLQDELLPHQWNDPRYRLRYNKKGDVVVTGKQRSWVVNMLRKFLGDKNVAFFILQHGLPELFDAPGVCFFIARRPGP